MKKYKIRFNDRIYEVEMEEMDGDFSAQPSDARAENSSQNAVGGQGHTVQAPMPGNIIDVRVKSGDRVNEGQVIAILEAMKMENEICAPRAGSILSVSVNKGQNVNVGDALLCIG